MATIVAQGNIGSSVGTVETKTYTLLAVLHLTFFNGEGFTNTNNQI
jgi:hypothetical protein